jgi:c(7)-type cytochrome triheme protein
MGAFAVFACANIFLDSIGTNALAEEDGGIIIFSDTKAFAPVIFSHEKHSKAGAQCTDCHDQLFKKINGSTDVDNALKMKAIKKGKFCGSCHDGKKTFTASKNCDKCHPK